VWRTKRPRWEKSHFFTRQGATETGFQAKISKFQLRKKKRHAFSKQRTTVESEQTESASQVAAYSLLEKINPIFQRERKNRKSTKAQTLTNLVVLNPRFFFPRFCD